jgi:oxygen-dependent protoporphyrinogen oxidase
MTEVDVVVIGAGITGLSTAFYLREAGYRVLVLEASSRVGGVIDSGVVDGYQVEFGPHTVLADSLIEDIIRKTGLATERVPKRSEARDRYLLNQHRPSELCPLPRSIISAIRSPLLSSSEKLRILAEPLFARRCRVDDMSMQDFLSSHFGTGCTRQIVEAVFTGVWAGDLSQMSARSNLPKLWEGAERFRSLVLAALRQPRTKRSILSFRTGLSALPRAIANSIGDDALWLSTPAQTLTRSATDVIVQTSRAEIHARMALLCLPAKATAALISPTNQTLAAAIAAIPHSSLGITHLCGSMTDSPSSIEGFGFLTAPVLRNPVMGCLFVSSLFANRSPSGSYLLSAFSGGALNPALAAVDTSAVQNAVGAEVGTLLKLRQNPRVLSSRVWRDAVPNYPLNHHQLLADVSAFEVQNPRLRLLGNWRDGVSISDRFRSAQTQALAAVEFLGKN